MCSSRACAGGGFNIELFQTHERTDELRKNRVNSRQNVSASLDRIFFPSDNSRERPELDDVLSLSFPPDISRKGSNLCVSAKTTATCSARDAEVVSFVEEMVETREEVVSLPTVIVKLRTLELTTAVLYQIRCGFDSSRWKVMDRDTGTKHKRLCVLRLGAMAEGFRKRFGETVTGETKNAATLNAKTRAVMFLIGNNISGGAIWWSQTSP
ncbi:hypothetical protein DY000_02009815 [Brassica cretica]|uniref:Uncharacterized protein n=1 Tax=Brassica cretica TaxID=69181 RepID=A0ABQ7C782_BRACR|nr:hypothetical protein DY000_02009815 [Brassica cretica]